jgi:hypothetical protein
MKTHTNDRSFVCTVEGCTYSTVQKGNLKAHERKHAGEKPFKCEVPGCGYTATQSGHLTAHNKRKHPEP